MLSLDQRALRICWTVFLFLLLLGVIYEIRDTLLVFAGAIFFAYMLSPIVGVVERLFRSGAGWRWGWFISAWWAAWWGLGLRWCRLWRTRR